jgi:hypothetical protein
MYIKINKKDFQMTSACLIMYKFIHALIWMKNKRQRVGQRDGYRNRERLKDRKTERQKDRKIIDNISDWQTT